jgi:multiple sugar transport system permease protein
MEERKSISLVARTRKRIAFYFLLPLAGVMLCLVIWPLFYTIYLSFRYHNLYNLATRGWAGFHNYAALFSNSLFWHSVKKQIIYVIVVVGVEFIFGFFIALLLDRKMKGINFLRGLIVVPLIMAPVVVGFFWRFLFEPTSGLINYLFSLIGLKGLHWIDTAETALIAVMIVDIWQWTPFMAIVLLAGIQSVQREVTEASMLDGLGFFKHMRYVLLPIIKPVILIVVLIRCIDAIKVFDSILVLTRGGPGTSTFLMNVFNYDLLFMHLEAGEAATCGLMTIILINIVAISLIKTLSRRVQA